AEAKRAGVELVYALAPGLSICYSDDGEFASLVAKAEQLRGAGVESFHLLFDDIDAEFHCDRHGERFGSLAAAQAGVTNRFFSGPLRGSASARACAPVVGVLAKPMVQCVPSKRALATIADYSRDPVAYDPERSFVEALREVGREVIDAL